MKINKKNFQTFGFSRAALIIVIALIIVTGITGGILYWQKKEVKPQPPPTTPTTPTTPTEIPAAALAKRLIKPEDIILEKAEVAPKIPKYNLPLKTKDISNYQDFFRKISVSPKSLSLLKKNGFVAVSTPKDIADSKKDDFAAYYKAIKDRDLQVFVTTDSLLHYYHIFFDTTLMRLERDLFYDDVWQMSKELLDDSVNRYNVAKGDLKIAAKRNIAYLSVGLELLKPKENQIMSDKTLREEYCKGAPEEICEIIISGIKESGEKASFKYFSQSESKKYDFKAPVFVKDLVQKEIKLIENHQGWEYSPIFIYKEDYSQYVPRGHYTKSEKLKNYFKAMMWYGRMTALIKGSPLLSKGKSICTGPMNGIISEYDAKIQTLQASLIASKFSQSKDIQEKWKRMYAITGFFVGFSDDLGPYEYGAILNALFKEKVSIQQIEERYPALRDALLNLPYNPKIYSGLGACELSPPSPPLSDQKIQELKVQAKKLLKETKGFRLMGQRFTIDSWLFSEIVSPYSGEYIGDKSPKPFTWVRTGAGREVRGFPRGLDIMALFGSERAKEILKELGDTQYSDYEKKFTQLKKEIDSLSTEDWFKNLYWNWLYTLRSLLGKFGQGYQTFMQTKAWQDKELNTALASWAELRHDTLLYVKQSYTVAEMGMAPPPPIRGYVEPVPEFYARLLTLTKMTNKGLQELVPAEELEKLKIKNALNRFAEILNKLAEISKKELENKILSETDYDFIRDFGDVSTGLIKILSGGDVDPDIFKTTLIADVHSEGNTKKVLEEGVGYIKTLVVAYKLPQGHIVVGAGPVFSYYEFKQPMKNRLTDEVWREMLNTQPLPQPKWVKSFSE